MSFLPIPRTVEEDARAIGGGRGGRMYKHLREYVASQTGETVTEWEKDDDVLHAITIDLAATEVEDVGGGVRVTLGGKSESHTDPRPLREQHDLALQQLARRSRARPA